MPPLLFYQKEKQQQLPYSTHFINPYEVESNLDQYAIHNEHLDPSTITFTAGTQYVCLDNAAPCDDGENENSSAKKTIFIIALIPRLPSTK